MMNDSDALSLDIMAATLSVGEPSGTAVLRIKVAVLEGKATYSPPPLPTAVNSAAAYDLFASGQYQGCDATAGCNPDAAVFGSGPGLLGLDAGLATLESDATDCITFLLECYPDGFARQFPKSTVIQGDPTSSLAQTLSAVESVVRSSLPILATSLRYKQAFLIANRTTLNTQALAALASGVAMSSANVSLPASAATATATASYSHATMTPQENASMVNAHYQPLAPAGLAHAAASQAMAALTQQRGVRGRDSDMVGYHGRLVGPRILAQEWPAAIRYQSGWIGSRAPGIFHPAVEAWARQVLSPLATKKHIRL
jgi:hypothetical protein